MSSDDEWSRIWRETAQHAAARQDDREALGRALAVLRGGEATAARGVDHPDAIGFTALHVAAGEASAELAGDLLAAGAAAGARTPRNQLTPLMLAVTRGRLAAAEVLLAAGADPNATGDPSLFSMLSCSLRGGCLAILERLIAAGFALRPEQASAYFRHVLELTGHGVRHVERGICRGIAGDTDDRWLVDRPMSVPAALMAPLAALDPQYGYVAGGLDAALCFYPAYAASFAVDPKAYAAATDLEPPGREPVPVVELAHEVRCRRIAATAGGVGGWSALGRAITYEEPALVLALTRSAGLDPAELAAESDDEAARNAAARGLYPVHLRPIRELLRQALGEVKD